MEQDSAASPGGQRKQRKLRNLLIDKDIQLRFTWTAMLIISLVCVSLALVLYWQGQVAHRLFDSQRRASTALFKQQLTEHTRLLNTTRKQAASDAQKLLQAATGMLDLQLKDKDPDVREAAKLAKQTLLKDDKQRIKRQLTANASFLKKRKQINKEQIQLAAKQNAEASRLEKRQTLVILLLLAGFCILMLVLVFIFSIRVTHRVAGPLFKLGRYVDAIKENQLGELSDLRKNDLIQEFYQRFKGMHTALKERTQEDADLLAEVLKEAEAKGLSDDTLAKLQAGLEAKQQALSTDSADS
jgi:nitrogen fixation/metabolism regulation signal transduction histidine kinase